MDLPDLPEPPPDEDAPATSTDRDAQKSDTFYKQLQVVTTFVTLVVAVTAIGLSVWEGYETRKYNRLTVQPYLKSNSVTTYSRKPDGVAGNLTHELESNGLGPAVYTKILMYGRTGDSWRLLHQTETDGEYMFPYMKDTFLARALSRTEEAPAYTAAPLMQGFFHPKGQSVPFFSLSLDPDETFAGLSLDEVTDSLSSNSVVVCYCSVYGEDCSHTNLFGNGPDTVPCEN